MNWKCYEKRGEERENAEGGITGIKGRLKIILRLNLTIQMMIKRNITDFGIIGYKYRSLNCNEKRVEERKSKRVGLMVQDGKSREGE